MSHLEPGCYACDQAARDPEVLPDREQVVRTAHWRVAHAFDSSLPGWLVLLPTAHVLALDELGPDAHAELGVLLGSLSAALRAVVRCEKTYVMQFSEAEGFAHLHVHLVPRMADLAPESRGPRIFTHLGADDATRVPEVERDRLARALREVVAPG